MTFTWNRFDIEAPSANPDNLYDHIGASDSHYVLAEDAINREAVNADKIRTLEVQLKETKRAMHLANAHLEHKNKLLVQLKKLINAEFDRKE